MDGPGRVFQSWFRALILIWAVLVVLVAAGEATAAKISRVPQDYPTIQAAIDASANGDTVLVAAGTYDENINLGTKALTVVSEEGAAATIIDGGNRETVVRMFTQPGTSRLLKGFTVRNGFSGNLGGGIRIDGAYPFSGVAAITDNVVTENVAANAAGIYSTGAALDLRRNTIRDNRQIVGYSGGIGAGVRVDSFPPFGDDFPSFNVPIMIERNLIEGNTINGFGAGLAVLSSGDLLEANVTISENVIRENCSAGSGAGVYLDGSNALVVNNLIVGNRTACGTFIGSIAGGGLFWNSPNVSSGPALLNNTIVGNEAPDGSAVAIAGFSGDTIRISNNVLVGGGSSVLVCSSLPTITYNDVYANDGAAPYAGACPDAAGSNGNIAQDPVFASASSGDFHLTQNSPAVDAGTNSGAPGVALDGAVRPQDGDGDGVAITDMGAYELPSPADADGDGVADTSDNCPSFSNPGQTDSDANGIGNECECGDQSGNGVVNIMDIMAMSNAIFGYIPVSPLCDANYDALCNVSDIVGAYQKIFGRPAYCSRYPPPGVP